MKFDDLTIGEARQLASMFSSQPALPADVTGAWEIGKNYLIRTVTMIDVGEVKSANPQFIVLTKASWIADTGRFHQALNGTGKLSEVEMFKSDVIIAVGAIVDATEWTTPLPTSAEWDEKAK